MEVFFLVIEKTDATRTRMSLSFHRGKMAVKAKTKKRRGEKKGGTSKPLLSSVKQTNKSSYFFSALRFYWLKCGFVSCLPLPCRSAQCNVWLAEGNRASPWRAELVPREGCQLAPAGESWQLLCSSYPKGGLHGEMTLSPQRHKAISSWNGKKSSVAEWVTLTELISLLWEQQCRICHLQSFS